MTPKSAKSSSLSAIISSPSVIVKMSDLPIEIQNLIKSERIFVDRLHALKKNYLLPIRAMKILSSYEIISLFANFEELLLVHQNLLKKFETMRYSFDEIFEQSNIIFQPYIMYCCNLVFINDIFNQLISDNNQFSELISSLTSFNFVALLRSPHLRFFQYSKYLKDIIHYYSKVFFLSI